MAESITLTDVIARLENILDALEDGSLNVGRQETAKSIAALITDLRAALKVSPMLDRKELLEALKARKRKLVHDYGTKPFLTPEEEWLDALIARLEAEPEVPITAHSKSENKRLMAQGANVLSRCPTCWALCRMTEDVTDPNRLRYEHYEPEPLAEVDAWGYTRHLADAGWDDVTLYEKQDRRYFMRPVRVVVYPREVK